MNAQSDVIFQQMAVGPMGNLIYFIGDATTNEVLVVDPAWDVDFLLREAQKKNYTITGVFLTHGHGDHTNGLDEMISQIDVPVYFSKHEGALYKSDSMKAVEIDDHDKITVGNLQMECLHTPGHSLGCQCLKYNDILITGDTLFIDGCGRCDLPGGNAKAMYHTLYEIILKLSDTTMIYPGHDYGPVKCASLSDQKNTNPYLRCRNMEEFLTQRMGLAL